MKEKLKRLLDRFIKAFSISWAQPSTKKGILALLGSVLAFSNPEHAEAIITGVLALYGVYQAMRDETNDISK